MGSKHILTEENDISRMDSKRFRHNVEETRNNKKTTHGGRTPAQIRLERIKQQLRDAVRAKEAKARLPVNKCETSQVVTISKMDKKESSAVNKAKSDPPREKKKRGKTLVQGRLEKYQHNNNNNKKEEMVHAISSHSKKVDKKSKKETINSAIKSFMNKVSSHSGRSNEERTASEGNTYASSRSEHNARNKINYVQPPCQTNVIKSSVTNKSNLIAQRNESKMAKPDEINRNVYTCRTNMAKTNEINRNDYKCQTNMAKTNEINRNDYKCQTNMAKPNEINRNDYKCQTNMAKPNEINRNDYKCQTNMAETNVNKAGKVTSSKEIIKNNNTSSNKRKILKAKSTKETTPNKDNSVVKNVNLLPNLYKRKPVDNNAISTILNKKKVKAQTEKTPVKGLNTIRKAIMHLNEVNSTNKFDQTVSNEIQDKSNISEDIEDMEWEPVCPDITSELKTVRNAVINDEFVEMMDWQESVLDIDKVPDNNIIHYVIDSNIFISSLEIVKKIKESDGENIIVVPWQVLKELDSLKKGSTSNVAMCARKAIQYLLSCQNNHTSNVVWQTQKQANQHCQYFTVEIPDDHIIKCCFQLSSSGHNVVLLSNDKNLRLKASVHNIATISDEKLLEKMAFDVKKSGKLPLEKPPKGTTELEIFAHKFTEVFKAFLNNIIQQYLKTIYGNMWIWHIPEKPPISLKVLLELIQNFSSKIFTNHDCQKYINQINTFFNKQTYDTLIVHEFDGIVRDSIKLAKFLPQDENYLLKSLEFEDSLAFLKAREPSLSPIPYNDLCCKLTVQHFHNFESLLIGYCRKTAEVLGINFTDSVLSERRYILPAKYDIKLIPHYIKALRDISMNLERISKTEPEQISVYTRTIISIYNTLILYVEDCDKFFTIEDVAEFCKHSSIRSNLPEALREFNAMKDFLETAKSIAVSQKLM